MNTKPSRPLPVGGLVLFRQGFRPFFLAGGLWGFVSVALWLAMLNGAAAISTGFGLAAWHAHEMIFGYTGAVIAGFLLTAIPNWTGRLPLRGLPLALLFTTWLVGRVVMAISIHMPPILVAVLDLLFLAALFLVVLREIVAGRNWRNLPMPIALAGLLLANGLTHLEAVGRAQTGLVGQRLGIAIIVMLIGLVGGRIIPSFTRNWLAKRAETRMPTGFGRFDHVCLLITLVALGGWVVSPDSRSVGAALLVAGFAGFARLARWRGHRTLSEPLVWSLHLGFAWVPVGLGLLGLGAFFPELFPTTAGLHALTVGAIASMTLAVMTRATLGHSGRPLTADRCTTAIYTLIATAAAARVAAPIAVDGYDPLLWASGLLWSAAFGLFTVHYGRMLLAR